MTLRHITLLAPLTISTAIGATVTLPPKGTGGVKGISVQANFLYGSGGTTVKCYVQTSFDNGANWCDIMCFSFTTAAARKVSKTSMGIALAAATVPTDATLANDSIVDGLLGSQFRLKYVTTGTYAGLTSLEVHAVLSTDAP